MQNSEIKITILKRESRALSVFNKKQWPLVHPSHYGRVMDWDYWSEKKLLLQATKQGKIVGRLSGKLQAGVFYVGSLIVDYSQTRQGIGKQLMQKAEWWARQKGTHKIYLVTGVGWKAVPFYESLGYKKEARLSKHYGRRSFWLMAKFL